MMKRGQWIGAALAGGAVIGLLCWERRRPLREPTEGALEHDGRNLAVAALARLAIQHVENPVVEPLARRVEAQRLGLLQRARLPGWLELPAAILLMDYTLYLWHVLTHRLPFLWRFHQPHHVDRDLTASTAIRFHFGELILSTAWRAAQVRLFGIRPRVLHIWQRFVLVSIVFHHSNVRIPARIERWLSWLIVTPRLHGIHHSVVEAETNSNWSSGLTIWDWLHGTLRRDVPQEAITVGVPAYHQPQDLTLGQVLTLPFRRHKRSWRRPDGRQPRRASDRHLVYRRSGVA